ncbi:MAG: CRISPR-associated protein Csx15 [Anaerolineae bacterium]|nr:CRISPR-associated protein Csx15 [Anaerolineae bacterium]
MILLNFSHPLTAAQLDQVRALLGRPDEPLRLVEIPVQFDVQQPFAPQVQALLAQLPLSSAELQTEPILVNLPSLNYIAALLLAELHGRMGYFPPVVRLRPVAGSVPPRFEVAEVINLQALRDAARRQR